MGAAQNQSAQRQSGLPSPGSTPHDRPLPSLSEAALLPHLELLSRRPTGLELYRLDVDALSAQGLPPFILLMRPNGRAQLGAFSQRHVSAMETLCPGQVEGLLSQVLKPIESWCERRGCMSLLVRQEVAGEPELARGALMSFPGSYAHHCTYLQLQVPLPTLQARLTAQSSFETSLGRWSVEPLPAFAPISGTIMRRVPIFLPWLVDLFHRIFEDGADPEISSDISHQLALLELSLAAAWLQPELWVLRLEGQAVGMFLSRLCDEAVGELSFVGLIPALRGIPEAGYALMRACAEALARVNANAVHCAVADCNGRSRSFFERRWGFNLATSEVSWVRRF